MKEKNRGVVGVIADIYMGVIQNFLNFSVNLCCIVINRIIFNLIGFHLEQIKEKNDKCERHSNKVKTDNQCLKIWISSPFSSTAFAGHIFYMCF